MKRRVRHGHLGKPGRFGASHGPAALKRHASVDPTCRRYDPGAVVVGDRLVVGGKVRAVERDVEPPRPAAVQLRVARQAKLTWVTDRAGQTEGDPEKRPQLVVGWFCPLCHGAIVAEGGAPPQGCPPHRGGGKPTP